MFNEPILFAGGLALAAYLGLSSAPFKWQGAVLVGVLLAVFAAILYAINRDQQVGGDFASTAGFAVGGLLGSALVIVPAFVVARLIRHLTGFVLPPR